MNTGFLPVIGLDDVTHHMAVTKFSKGRGLREVTREVTRRVWFNSYQAAAVKHYTEVSD